MDYLRANSELHIPKAGLHCIQTNRTEFYTGMSLVVQQQGRRGKHPLTAGGRHIYISAIAHIYRQVLTSTSTSTTSTQTNPSGSTHNSSVHTELTMLTSSTFTILLALMSSVHHALACQTIAGIGVGCTGFQNAFCNEAALKCPVGQCMTKKTRKSITCQYPVLYPKCIYDVCCPSFALRYWFVSRTGS